MITLRNKIEELKLASMRGKIVADSPEAKQDAELKLDVARALLAALGEAETAGKVRKELTDGDVLAVLKSEAKKRRGSVEIYTAAGAADRAEREAAEADVIEGFLPKAPTELELQYFIADYVGANGLEGAGMKAMGEVMKVVREEFDNFDGAVASKLAAKILA